MSVNKVIMDKKKHHDFSYVRFPEISSEDISTVKLPEINFDENGNDIKIFSI